MARAHTRSDDSTRQQQCTVPRRVTARRAEPIYPVCAARSPLRRAPCARHAPAVAPTPAKVHLPLGGGGGCSGCGCRGGRYGRGRKRGADEGGGRRAEAVEWRAGAAGTAWRRVG
jgi:hypothetical protein